MLPWDLPDSEFTLPGILFAHCCLRHSQWQCSAHRISALRRGTGWYDRNETQSDSELVGQGLGNIIAPFFGGIPLQLPSRALPLTSVPGQLPLLGGDPLYSGYSCPAGTGTAVSWLPLSAMAALLLMVAWNMVKRTKWSTCCVMHRKMTSLSAVVHVADRAV